MFVAFSMKFHVRQYLTWRFYYSLGLRSVHVRGYIYFCPDIIILAKIQAMPFGEYRRE